MTGRTLTIATFLNQTCDNARLLTYDTHGTGQQLSPLHHSLLSAAVTVSCAARAPTLPGCRAWQFASVPAHCRWHMRDLRRRTAGRAEGMGERRGTNVFAIVLSGGEEYARILPARMPRAAQRERARKAALTI